MYVRILVADLAFSQSTYNISENAGHLQPVIILSNPSSTAVIVQVFTSTNDSTVGE